MAGNVFISYRRDDSAGHAGRVHDRLEREFGRDLLFMDVDSVPLGVNFVNVLSAEVAKCDVLLAVIGPNWLTARDEDGNRRLDNPQDFVRIEIGAALQRNIPVIPILLDGAKVPKASQLPKELEELSLRNGLDVRHVSFHNDVDKLVRSLKGQLAEGDARRRDNDERRQREAEIKKRADEEGRRTKSEKLEDEAREWPEEQKNQRPAEEKHVVRPWLSRNRLLVATGLVILLASCVWIATNVLQKSSTTISQTAASNSPPAIPATAASRPQDSTATTPSSANSAATSDDLLNMAFCGCAREATMEKLLACQNQCVVEMQRKSDESHKRALEAAERLRP